MYSNKIFFKLIFYFIIILYLPYIFQSFKSPIHEYVFSDLHINYVSGFIRRGLLGELARILNPLIGNVKFFAIIFTTLYFIQIILLPFVLYKVEIYREATLTLFIIVGLSFFQLKEANDFYFAEGVYLID